jgi:nucleotide-binding universal stress UspA family protein
MPACNVMSVTLPTKPSWTRSSKSPSGIVLSVRACTTHCLIRTGLKSRRSLEAAGVDVDMLWRGAGGRGAFYELVIGSVSEEVIQNSRHT